LITKIRFVIASITLAAAAVWSVNAEEPAFRAKAAGEYVHQTVDKVTVGAKTFNTQELTAQAFGKKPDLLKYGVLPVLVVIENKRDKALDLQNLRVELVASDGRHVTSVSPEDITYLGTAGKKHPSVNPVPLPVPLPKKKNPLSTPDLLVRAFSAKVLAPGDTASGFFYFEAKPETGDSVYLNGMHDARSGQEIMYFEFPFEKGQ
jgi:hypothetical protein